MNKNKQVVVFRLNKARRIDAMVAEALAKAKSTGKGMTDYIKQCIIESINKA